MNFGNLWALIQISSFDIKIIGNKYSISTTNANIIVIIFTIILLKFFIESIENIPMPSYHEVEKEKSFLGASTII